MNKKITALLFATLLLISSCAPTKPAVDKCCKEKTEVVSSEKDPLMKLLVSGLIILSINLMIK